ncbi:MAG: HD-GYP domain-containing protein [Leptospiraceae bacterium]|nr:HD-GYP domain-containing protein [Leptospiraceae bacterium]
MKLKLHKLRPGTILEGNVSKLDGTLLFVNSTVFTKEIIEYLKSQQILEISYLPKKKLGYNTQEKKEEEIIENILLKHHSGVVQKDNIRKILHALNVITNKYMYQHDSIDFQSCKDIIQEMLERIKKNPTAIVNLLRIKNHDDYTFSHSVNVGIIALTLANRMGYSDEDVQLIGLGGMLHDVGKVAVPASLLNKTTVLSEKEKRIIKSHPIHSYRILRTDKSLDPRIIQMAYGHHERYDGKGYPLGISGDKLDDTTVIVALADVYDALTTVRSYKPAFSPEESIQVIETYTGNHFSPRIAEKFIGNIQKSISIRNEYRKGSLVLLNTNEIAQILDKKQKVEGEEIIVQLLTDKSQIRLKYPLRISLQENKERQIKRSIKSEEIDGDSLRVNKIKSTNL